VICVSNYTRAEFLNWSKVDPTKVHVIRNGAPYRFVTNKSIYKLDHRYILYPGNHRAYKNLDRLLRAFAQSNIAEQGIHLLLTGDQSPELKRTINALSLEQVVHFCGRVPADQLPKLYKGAEAVVFVSLYEGFGLPILEGMASDVPVITSAVSAMPEVAGDAALLVDPHSVDAIAEALKRITTDETLRIDLIEKGRRRLTEFDWDLSAAKFWCLVREVAAEAGDGLVGAGYRRATVPAPDGQTAVNP
jgi:glycosyltransferase involved in cell wall biosynthesis